jgi:hypothetical protein
MEVQLMVMRNRHDGANAHEWWDDLPPGIKKRCANSPYLKIQDRTGWQPQDQQDDSSPSARGIARDLSWLALIIFVIALANLLFMLVAISFLHDRALFAH